MIEINQYQNRPFTEPWNSMTELRFAQQITQVNTCVTLNDEIGEMPGFPGDECDYCGNTHDYSDFDCQLEWEAVESALEDAECQYCGDTHNYVPDFVCPYILQEGEALQRALERDSLENK